MSFIGAAIVATATVGGAIISSSAAKKAANAQTDAASEANALQRYQYDTTRADQAPWRQIGNQAIGALSNIYFGGGSASGGPARVGSGSTVNQPANSNGAYPATGGRDANGLLPNSPYYTPPGFTRGPDDSGAPIPGYTPANGNALAGGQTVQDYLAANPDLAAEAQRVVGSDPRFPTTEAYLAWHDQNYGSENRASPLTQPAQPTTGTGTGDRFGGFFESPDYQFRLAEGNNALQRASAATHQSQSGGTLKALTRYGQGMASGEWRDYVNQLNNLAGFGQTANSANQVAGMNYANNAGRNLLSAGDARASGYQNQAASLNYGLNGLANVGQNIWNQYRAPASTWTPTPGVNPATFF